MSLILWCKYEARFCLRKSGFKVTPNLIHICKTVVAHGPRSNLGFKLKLQTRHFQKACSSSGHCQLNSEQAWTHNLNAHQNLKCQATD